MLTRSNIRYACFRKQSGTALPKHEETLDEVKKILIEGDTWENFSNTWDIFVGKGKIHRIVPEKDYDYVHTSCTEFKVKTSLGMSNEEIYEGLNDRQKNLFDVVLLNCIEADFSGYGETFKVSIDGGSSRIEVRSLKNKRNLVPKPKPKVAAVAVREAINTTINMDEAEEIEDRALVQRLKDLLKKEGIKL